MAKSKTIGVAVDFSNGSKLALDWAIFNLLDKDDTLYVIHVKPLLRHESPNLIWSKTGSPLIPLDEFRDKLVLEKYEVDLDDQVLDSLDKARKQKHATVIVKIYWGDARDKLCSAVEDVKLDCLVMGSRGLGSIQRVILGSVTNFVMVNAHCPVTIVKDPASTSHGF